MGQRQKRPGFICKPNIMRMWCYKKCLPLTINVSR
jgi:hypothetical protein